MLLSKKWIEIVRNDECVLLAKSRSQIRSQTLERMRNFISCTPWRIKWVKKKVKKKYREKKKRHCRAGHYPTKFSALYVIFFFAVKSPGHKKASNKVSRALRMHVSSHLKGALTNVEVTTLYRSRDLIRDSLIKCSVHRFCFYTLVINFHGKWDFVECIVTVKMNSNHKSITGSHSKIPKHSKKNQSRKFITQKTHETENKVYLISI